VYQKIFVADLRKIAETIGWRPRVSFREGLKKQLDWTRANAAKD